VLLAELNVRHTRRHMPTRRVALDGAYLPTTGPAHGAALLSAVVATNLPAVDEEQRDLLPRLLDDARRGLTIPRIALRHRLQYDVHGLDRSRHRLIGEDAHLVVELDVHGAQVPQVLGAVLGAASLPSTGRSIALEAIRKVVNGRWRGLAPDVTVRYISEASWNAGRPPLAANETWTPGAPPEEELWIGIGPDERWAREVLGLRAEMDVVRDDVNRRFRRLLREAHPDSGGASAGAAARIAELTEARAILLDAAADEEVAAEG
jgi:hypothetical protein